MQIGSVVTDHRMIFALSPRQTTLYDEIEYSGSPSSFAWVLPIHGLVNVRLSADVVFAALEETTKTIIAPSPPSGCPPPSACDCALKTNFTSVGSVTVQSQQVVGPYDTVQISSTDPGALSAWLSANGFAIPSSVHPVIAAYVGEGFDFLAMRLAPGQGVQAMRPVSVTSTGAGLSLPLRMVAAGTGATVGVTLWVVAAGRYEPQNFAFFTISASDLVWDWSRLTSNYAAVRIQREAALGNAAWQTESSIDLAPAAVEAFILSVPAETDYPTTDASDAGAGRTADEARREDLATLFPAAGATVRITRMRADLSHDALATDLALQASADQVCSPTATQ
jgi:hypothetical protein